WKPVLKENVKAILTAWFLPAVLTFLGALIYFLIFPGHFDLSGSFLDESVPGALEQLEAQGLTYTMYVLITAVSCVTYTPLINMVPAVGEEAGWRGFLYPQLKEMYGRTKGILLGGVIWGAWHWPLIWLIGYEYGTDYPGFPVVGMLIFCVFTVCAGILHDVLYEKSRCIWIPALFHGALNAAATLPLAVCRTDTGPARLLGPVPNGLIAGLPMIICALIILRQTQISSDN
ncbi:MAG: CPBP family intramembrane metalloprotease, partial [Erysipelotrichaceae bacterium]|nr:CPBP family intramembrane metalloprotease [Erysipelotrichaceae bacterium]